MKDKKLFIVLIPLSFILGIWVNGLFSEQYKNKTQSKDTYTSDKHIFEDVESNNLSLKIEKELISYSKDTYLLKDITCPDSMYLIFKYPLSYCGICIDEICEVLEQYKDIIPSINVILIASGGSFRDMRVKMHPYKDKFPVYLISDNDLGLPVDKSNVPYLVFINDGKTSKHTFVVSSGFTELIKEYLHELFEKYCSPPHDLS